MKVIKLIGGRPEINQFLSSLSGQKIENSHHQFAIANERVEISILSNKDNLQNVCAVVLVSSENPKKNQPEIDRFNSIKRQDTILDFDFYDFYSHHEVMPVQHIACIIEDLNKGINKSVGCDANVRPDNQESIFSYKNFSYKNVWTGLLQFKSSLTQSNLEEGNSFEMRDYQFPR